MKARYVPFAKTVGLILILSIWSHADGQSDGRTLVTGTNNPTVYRPVTQDSSIIPPEMDTMRELNTAAASDKPVMVTVINADSAPNSVVANTTPGSVSSPSGVSTPLASSTPPPSTCATDADCETSTSINHCINGTCSCSSAAPLPPDPCPGDSVVLNAAGLGCFGQTDCGAHQATEICIGGVWTPSAQECCSGDGNCGAAAPASGACGSPTPAAPDPCPGDSVPLLSAGLGCPPTMTNCGVHKATEICIGDAWTPSAQTCCSQDSNCGARGDSSAPAVVSPASQCLYNYACGLVTNQCSNGSAPGSGVCPCMPCGK